MGAGRQPSRWMQRWYRVLDVAEGLGPSDGRLVGLAVAVVGGGLGALVGLLFDRPRPGALIGVVALTVPLVVVGLLAPVWPRGDDPQA